MKHSVKITAITLSILVALGSLTACSLIKDNGDTTTTTEATEETSELNLEGTIVKTTAKETTTTTTTETKVEKESIDTILNLIQNFPVGTAGSTAKSVDIALRLINFAEACDDTASVESDSEKYFETLTADKKMIFEENLFEIDAIARKLIDGNSSFESYIEQSSEDYDKGNYDLEKYEEIYEILKNI